MRQRHVIAAIAAVVFTLGSAAAAIALNVGAGAPEPTSAGQLATRTLAPPSTLYVDVTIPDLPPGSSPQVDPSATGTSAGGSTTVTTDPPGDDHGFPDGHDADD